MATTNDITGDTIVSKPTSNQYRINWGRIFDWIPISDRLPPTSETVEVKTKDGNVHEVYLCRCGSEWRDSFSGYQIMIDVTHWRTL